MDNRTEQIEALTRAYKNLRAVRASLTAPNQVVCDAAITRVQTVLLAALPGITGADFNAAERSVVLELDGMALRALCAAKAQSKGEVPPEAFVFPETY